jgi:hypothetical protein
LVEEKGEICHFTPFSCFLGRYRRRFIAVEALMPTYEHRFVDRLPQTVGDTFANSSGSSGSSPRAPSHEHTKVIDLAMTGRSLSKESLINTAVGGVCEPRRLENHTASARGLGDHALGASRHQSSARSTLRRIIRNVSQEKKNIRLHRTRDWSSINPEIDASSHRHFDMSIVRILKNIQSTPELQDSVVLCTTSAISLLRQHLPFLSQIHREQQAQRPKETPCPMPRLLYAPASINISCCSHLPELDLERRAPKCICPGEVNAKFNSQDHSPQPYPRDACALPRSFP